MKNHLSRSRRVAALAAIFALLAASTTAQLKLRTALDFDKDGKADFSIFRPSNNVWYVAKSGGGADYTQFGLANDDFMTPGDYDGDGKADIAVWRDPTGVFYWLNSSDGTFHAIQFGISQDEPVARDYDGDGKTDL